MIDPDPSRIRKPVISPGAGCVPPVPAGAGLRPGARGRRSGRGGATCVPTLALLLVLHAGPWVPGLAGQGLVGGAVSGTVRATDGSPVDGTRVTVVHEPTGYLFRTEVRSGRFHVRGLEVGGPYTLRLERLGFRTTAVEGLFLTLGEPLDVEVTLEPAAIALDAIDVTPPAVYSRATAHGGTGAIVPDSLLHRLPTLNRNLYDFVHLAPQVSTRTGLGPGMVAGGVGFRFNDFRINGVSERSTGSNQPPEFAGGRSLPFDAVREYEILLAPFDVRYGDFAGALVNAVTRSGTNRFQGSAFVFGRSDAFGRSGPIVAAEPHERLQHGVSLGGPLKRDRAHFFVASEVQHHASPAPGPFLEPAGTGEPAVGPVAATDLARLESILDAYGLEAGSGGPVTNRSPVANLFGRIDLGLPEWNGRAALWVNAARSSSSNFARRPRGSFPLSTHRTDLDFGVRSAALQLHTELPGSGGGRNEILGWVRQLRASPRPAVRQPIVEVGVPGTTGGTVTVVTGTPPHAQGSPVRLETSGFRNGVTLPLGGSHVLALGVEAEWFRVESSGPLNAFGTWTFANLDSLEAGVAERFELAQDPRAIRPPLTGTHFAAYLGDRWRPSRGVTITSGLRAEVLAPSGTAPYNADVDSLFGLRTDERPARRLHLSPRLGFTWDLRGTGRDQLRGGVGIFTGRPPLAWLHAPRLNHGIGVGVLKCGSEAGDQGPVPPFTPDHTAPPVACGDGATDPPPPASHVDLLEPDLRMARTLRGVLAYDRLLPWGLLATVEAMVTRNRSDFQFENLNLAGPVGVDRNGRVMYGTLDADGTSHPAMRDTTHHSVIQLRNASRNRSRQVAVRLERRFSSGLAASASYTHSRVRDVQTPLRVNVPGHENWESRAVSGRHDDTSPGISLNDIPHRVVVAATYRPSWGAWSPEVSFFYVGESGSPFTFLVGGAGLRGDLNADGSNRNDPVYVPRTALDPDEIRFSGVSNERDADNSDAARAERIERQRVALEAFIDAIPCLRRQRGGILERNSCREPWTHTTVAALRQPLFLGGHKIELQLDVFNVLNLLNRGWGRVRIADPFLLEHVSQAPDPSGGPSRPVFRFDDTRPRWETLGAESAFQLQVGLRYRF